MAQLSASISTTSSKPDSLPTSSGPINTSIPVNRDTTLLLLYHPMWRRRMPEKSLKRKKKLDHRDQEFQRVVNMVPDAHIIVAFSSLCRTRSLFSKATRPMLAFDLKTKKIIFIKDYYSPNVTSVWARHVQYMAPSGTGNDVREHVTHTQELTDKGWALRRRPQGGEAVVLTPLCQYRMTLLVIGEPLINFKSSKQFVAAIADAMKAHDGAYFKARILHSDISVGNIIIHGACGLLIDWDMCAKVNADKLAPRRPKRIGTWQFMSAQLLIKRNHFHDIEDDRESALYVLLWTALRYTKHSQLVDDISVTDFLEAFDEARPDGSGGFTGGSLKRSFLRGNSELHFDNCPQLEALAGHLCRAVGVRYTGKPGPEAPAALAEWHNDSLQLLRNENWFIDIMQKFLNSDGWPT